MGVKGLTSFIAKNAEQYLKPFELHDCNLVIDGDNLACNLYKDVSNCNSAFGGDYDEYYRTVVSFFHLLFECNICPYVLFDGGYEQKKMKTVTKRLRGKISLIKHIDPNNSRPIFPLMMREVFIEAAKDCNVRIMRCIFEADDELAALARKLNCPLLSYDSDFYIHNVKYIPLITLTMKVFQKNVNKLGQCTELRQCQAKNLQKRKQANSGKQIVIENFKGKKTNGKTVKYLDCCMYRIENLIKKGSLSKEKLPIFAALLGNDYVEARAFSKFYSHVGLKGMNKKLPKHQKRILSLLRWLKYETKSSALNKILDCVKKEERDHILEQIETATEGYLHNICPSFEFFQINHIQYAQTDTDSDSEHSNIESDSEPSNIESDSEEVSLNDEICDEECIANEVEENYENCNEDSELSEEGYDFSEIDNNEEEKELYPNAQILDEPQSSNVSVSDSKNLNENIPLWLQNRIYSAELPRFFSDLVHLKLYINNPQIENFLYPDCNEISIPILEKNFALLHYPETPELRYLTRVTRLTNVIYKKIQIAAINRSIDHQLSDFESIKELFSPLKVNFNQLFAKLEKIPNDLKLYFLAIVYWSHQSTYSNLFHLKSLLICLVLMRTIDTKIEPIRNEKQFNKKFGKLIQKEKLIRAKIDLLDKDSKEILKIDKANKLLNNLSSIEKIKYVTKSECLLVQENVLKYFNLPENLRKKHTEYSSSIIHGFAEFQSVVFQLYSLNALVNYPLESIRMSQLYSGLFLYNIYINLKDRPDIMYYIEHHIFKESKIMFGFFNELIEWCKEFVPFLKEDKIAPSKKVLKKKLELKKKKNKDIIKNDILELEDNENDFNDLNNKFNVLLKI